MNHKKCFFSSFKVLLSKTSRQWKSVLILKTKNLRAVSKRREKLNVTCKWLLQIVHYPRKDATNYEFNEYLFRAWSLEWSVYIQLVLSNQKHDENLWIAIRLSKQQTESWLQIENLSSFENWWNISFYELTFYDSLNFYVNSRSRSLRARDENRCRNTK